VVGLHTRQNIGAEHASLAADWGHLAVRRPGGEVSALSAVAHDLRGPLTALATSSEILVEDFDALERGAIHGMVSSIHRRVIWLQGLVENLLCAASIGEGKFRVQPYAVSLLDTAAEVQAVVEPLLAKRQQRLRVRARGPVPPALADERRIGQALSNLILNASKFSDGGTDIDVTLRTRGDSIRVTVADRGCGIPPKLIKRLFEPFFRADTSRTGREGLGLGLAIVHSVVLSHGGRVGARNRRGGGAEFWFELSIAPTDQSAVPIFEPSRSGGNLT
jgi:two-component system sensor histidine kinase KdpD